MIIVNANVIIIIYLMLVWLILHLSLRKADSKITAVIIEVTSMIVDVTFMVTDVTSLIIEVTFTILELTAKILELTVMINVNANVIIVYYMFVRLIFSSQKYLV